MTDPTPDPIIFKPDTVTPERPSATADALAVRPAAADAQPVLNYGGASVSYTAKQLIVGNSVYDLSQVRDIRHVVIGGVATTWLIGLNGKKSGEIPELNANAAFLAVQNAILPITRANGGD